MTGWARWCFRHRLVVVLLWLAALGGLGAGSGAAGAAYTDVFVLPGTDSARANALLAEAFPQRSGDTGTVVWRTARGAVREPRVRQRIEPALTEIARMPGVGSVSGPYEPGPAAADRISGDGRTAYARITFTEQANAVPKELVEEVVDTARGARGEGLRVELGGQAITRIQEPPAGLSEAVGLVAAALVLFLAFGSLLAMSLPIVVAVFGVGTGLCAATLLSHVTDVPEVGPLLGSLIGLGVGIDYALFIVVRHRRGLLRGADPEEAAVRALATSGRAVLFAGGTVCVALAGMLVMDMRFLDGVVLATSLTVVLSVLAALTLLPALLGVLGPRVLSGRRRRRLAAHGPEAAEASGLAARWSAAVQRRPRAVALAALLVMAALALPVLSLRLGASDQGNHREDTTTRRAYDLLAEGFGPGFNGPLQVVVEGDKGGAAAPAERLLDRIRDTEGVARAAAGPPARGVTVIEVVPRTSPQDAETDRLIDTLREEVVPGSGVRAHVGGVTAVFKDFSAVTRERLPAFVAAITGLGFVLLLLAFRSLPVPLTAALMNLLAAAASFGVLVAVFQWGWGAEPLGLGKEGPITSFLPVIMLSLLFGLSMDYQVFLVSRMHEEWLRTGDNARAVRVGLAETGRVIGCAALIMICVFAAFVLSGDTEGAMAGIGLAAAVALDAFLLRMALVPAAMHLLGRSNWWLPGRLGTRLPGLAVEGGDAPACPPTREPRYAPALPERVPVPVPAQPEHVTGPEPATDPEPPAVHGYVRASGGAPATDAVLTLLANSGAQLDRCAVRSDGSYRLTAPAPGTYLLAATSHGHGSRARHITVSAAALAHDVVLARAAPEGAGAQELSERA
ncbi:MMPL family transporter [Streptomyces sp. SCSIO ZS0520]|uniref:MMPL family transporter n=1 Tax=Streptomyces sp. SCSIO ZS0520 TaxID=2892996 RepID=UPI0021D8741C|nr:MMPL family transporter [Streptomyces sp. SCSIO ZS0520]